jgi:O-methyltransferase
LKAVTGLRILYNAVVNGDEWSRFYLSEVVARWIYPKLKFSEFGRIFFEDKTFMEYYEAFEGKNNYHSLDRKYTLDQLLKLVVGLEGDTAECGAYKGASSYLMCRRITGLNKKHHVFDSFEGLSKPGPADGFYWEKGNLAAGETLIHENLKDFDFVVYHRGWIPERFGEVFARRFCFVHIDVDLFQPTLDSLNFYYPRVVNGGIILCDDYGFITCPGARKAVDTFFEDKPEEVVSLTTGQGLVIRKFQ